MSWYGPPLRSGVEHLVCPCNTISDFPQPCPYHAPNWRPQPYVATTNTLSPLIPQGLSDEDIERIAERVAEKLRPKRKRKR